MTPVLVVAMLLHLVGLLSAFVFLPMVRLNRKWDLRDSEVRIARIRVIVGLGITLVSRRTPELVLVVPITVVPFEVLRLVVGPTSLRWFFRTWLGVSFAGFLGLAAFLQALALKVLN